MWYKIIKLKKGLIITLVHFHLKEEFDIKSIEMNEKQILLQFENLGISRWHNLKTINVELITTIRLTY